MKKKTYGSFEVNKYMHEHEKRVLEGLLFLRTEHRAAERLCRGAG